MVVANDINKDLLDYFYPATGLSERPFNGSIGLLK